MGMNECWFTGGRQEKMMLTTRACCVLLSYIFCNVRPVSQAVVFAWSRLLSSVLDDLDVCLYI